MNKISQEPLEPGITQICQCNMQRFLKVTKSYSGHIHLRPICDQNTMTLAQAVLEIFGSQASNGL